MTKLEFGEKLEKAGEGRKKGDLSGWLADATSEFSRRRDQAGEQWPASQQDWRPSQRSIRSRSLQTSGVC